jgi:hypothetical protein
VKNEVAGRLAQSLPHPSPINLRKEIHPQEVHPSWSEEVTLGPPPSTLLPPEIEMIEIFDQPAIAGQLLILGAPGAGKTTMLLHLASALLARAEANLDQPIPVLVNLSSWTDDHQPLTRWLVAELKSKYGVRHDVGQRWLEEDRLVPLLDGLDELEAIRQEPCVRAINEFQQGDHRPPHLFVCCRVEEYQHYTIKLQLHGAVHLLPLTAEQMHRYLIEAGRPELWPFLQVNPELSELATAPLFLSLLIVAFDAHTLEAWSSPLSQGGQHDYPRALFQRYIDRRLSPEGQRPAYAPEKTIQMLTWLATRLQAQAQTEFLVEKLQPAWLHSRAQQWLYHLGVVGNVTLIVGLVIWLISWLPDPGLPGDFIQHYKLIFAQMFGGQYDVILLIIFSLTPALIIGLQQTITPIETIRWSGERARRQAARGLRQWSTAGAEYGIYLGLLAGLVQASIATVTLRLSSPSIGGHVGKIIGLLAGLPAGVTAVLAIRPSVWWHGKVRERFASRWPSAMLYGLLCGLGMALGWWGFPYTNLVAGMATWLSVGIIAGLSQGLTDRRVFRWVDTLVVGLLGGLGGGAISWVGGEWLLQGLHRGLTDWIHLWLLGGLGVGATAGLVARLIAQLCETTKPGEPWQGPDGDSRHWLVLWLCRELRLGVEVALAAGVLLSVLAGVGQLPIIQAIGRLTSFLGLGLIMTLCWLLFLTLLGAVTGAFMGGIAGGLVGALSGGLTGPEIESRTTPNQGIRRSAVNVGVFTLVGGLTVGVIWGLVNLALAMLMTGRVPQAGDWWHVGLYNIVLWGFFCGLVPEAACIQHFTLRFVLWCSGVMPWHYVRFLDYATDRKLLQRVGGRYRFLHHLLRDHLAAMAHRTH